MSISDINWEVNTNDQNDSKSSNNTIECEDTTPSKSSFHRKKKRILQLLEINGNNLDPEIVDFMKMHDIDQLTNFCLDKYESTITKILAIVYRERSIDLLKALSLRQSLMKFEINNKRGITKLIHELKMSNIIHHEVKHTNNTINIESRHILFHLMKQDIINRREYKSSLNLLMPLLDVIGDRIRRLRRLLSLRLCLLALQILNIQIDLDFLRLIKERTDYIPEKYRVIDVMNLFRTLHHKITQSEYKRISYYVA